ncbi:MAG TPA: hypothetical protein VHT51_06250 [Micropepsaceae bacterium]|nr:hypothetical protein [Micropepsaceae bacterium]
MRSQALLIGSFIALLAVPAMAQGNNAINVFGTVDKMDATTISVKNDDGGTVETYKLAPNVLYIQQEKAKLSDIKSSDFVASAAVRKDDGKLHSTELRIFSEKMRGLGEGQRPMNDARNQTMTNATVTGTAIVNGSNVMKVKFPGGESDLVLDPDPNIPVLKFTDADKGIIKTGGKVRVQGVRNADGATVNRVTAIP